MRAMLLREAAPIAERPLALTDVPVPSPGPGEVLIRIAACGVCHTDLHVSEGDIVPPSFPVIPGHQIVGRVESRGDGAGRFPVGARVGVPWLFSACGSCPRCAEGRENLCEGARFTGFTVNGGYAELVTAPEAFVYPLPEEISDEAAAPLLCAGIIGYRALKLSRAEPGRVLGLYGFGASAHLTLQAAIHRGMRVFVFSRTPAHRRHAERLGAEWTGAAGDAPPAPLDAAISFAPVGHLVPAILEAMDRGAMLALAGVTMTPVPEIDYDRLLYHERAITSVANFTRMDAEEFLALAAAAPITAEVTTFPLGEANEALAQVKESKLDGAAVLRIS